MLAKEYIPPEVTKMCSGARDVREIKQLWYAAKFYYSLLPDLSKSEMDKTVGQWSNECENTDDFHVTSLFKFSCHIASCAIRLYSIDEKRRHERYENYQAWWKGQKSMRDFSAAELRCIIHCILRNVVAHNEKEGDRSGSYNELKTYYFGRSFNDLDEGIKDVVNSIAQDLKLGIKGEKIEVESFI
jgi:hypothetical protein